MAFCYRLLNNSTGVLLARGAQLVRESLFVRFENAPENATAIFECGGKECYRALSEQAQSDCVIPADFLDGTVNVTVAILDGSARPQKWTCEALTAERQENGSIFVAPDDTNLSQKVANLRVENDALRENIKELSQQIENLETRIQTMLEGYDLV